MKSILTALHGEFIKVRRSRLPLISILVIVFVTILLGFLMFVMKHPEYAGNARTIAQKAAMFGKAHWETYFNILSMLVSMIGLIGFGFIASWIFGREYSDHTMKDILALPVLRSHIVLAKFIVIAIWSMVLISIIFLFGLGAGFFVGLDGWSGDLACHGVNTFVLCGICSIILCTPVAFFACIGRGYLPPMGFVVVIIGMVQVAGFSGYGHYFPWAIPSLLSGIAGPGGIQLGIISYVLVAVTGIAGYTGTYFWWRFADHT